MSQDTTTRPEAPISGPVPGGDSTNALSRLAALWRLSGSSTGVLAGLLLLGAYLGATQPIFLTWGNITNVVASNSVVLVLAVGATFVIISGGLDLSTASAAAVTGMAYGLLLQHGQNALVAVAGALLVGLLLGVLNGVLIAYVKVSFLVVTLGTLSVFESAALVMSQGKTLNVFSRPGFAPIYRITNGDVGGIPYLMIFDVVLVVAAALVLRYTTFGRGVYALGSNREAARLNGINVARTTLSVFVIAGLAAAVASLIQVGRLTGASPGVDSTLLLTVVAAVLIGGTAYTGGDGGVGGTVLGVLFLGVIQNGLTLSDVSTFWRGTVNGTVLIVAVTLGVARHRGWLTINRGKKAQSRA
ncbi:ribonucleotide-diphosphate reductase subunit alpha [Paractinoplanes ferrugineus]|uniref:Ribonucleotide-diphosphate reductase subunit alpha n=1 Tax=Paractinoplanes ferrugineus TaxID=113564 RepID=A0A919J677_9ACTN|nr:ABC transporter permease [Actinoplanes ferrugineus]GIE13753.1 ribonucleotide-diphosphate reductase subunit alpha [Actinoplanes ferrugineus]